MIRGRTGGCGQIGGRVIQHGHDAAGMLKQEDQFATDRARTAETVFTVMPCVGRVVSGTERGRQRPDQWHICATGRIRQVCRCHKKQRQRQAPSKKPEGIHGEASIAHGIY